MDIVRGVPRYTLEDYETTFRERHLVPGAVEYWAARKPDSTALIHAGTGQRVSWRALDQTATALAGQLLRMGLGKGDFFATSLPFLLEHVFLEYACFKAGIIHAPLDLRLKPEEVVRSIGLIQAKAYAFFGRTPAADFGELGRAVKQSCPSVQKLIQFAPPGETIPGAVSASELLARAQNQGPIALPAIGRDDGAQVIFTTGSTGYPKPALLSHRSITCQNMCLGGGFGFGEQSRLLVNLPPSHVGGQSELLMSALYWGGSVVVLPVFDPAASLRAIHEHKVTLLGQIPAMFNLEWRLSSYREYDLSSLEAVLYGGQQVARPFLERLAQMAPLFGTGLGLTEASGFCTYTRLDGTVDEIAASIGHSMPVYPLSIREPMREDGSAGRELPDSEVGHVCFKGPQTFLGYVGDPDATRKAVSQDGFLYTGDMGFQDEDGLHFSGRAKWVLKPAGNMVFPGQVENHFCALSEKVAACGVVGAEHALFSEGIVAYVETKPGAELTEQELRQHARQLTSYMRPLHYVILPPGGLPLNRVVKTDYVRLSEMAREEVEKLRERRRWDRRPGGSIE